MKERVIVDSNGRKYITTEPEPKNKFNPDWDAIAVMVEEQQRMAKRIEELTKLVTSQGIRLMDSEAQPEPVCWMNVNDIDKTDWRVWAHGKPTVSMPLFASPPQREWQGLTDEEILEEYRQSYGDDGNLTDVYFARAIETKLKEKNG